VLDVGPLGMTGHAVFSWRCGAHRRSINLSFKQPAILLAGLWCAGHAG